MNALVHIALRLWPSTITRQTAVLIGLIATLGSTLLLPGCGAPPKDPLRPPVLSDRDWQLLVPIVGDFGPAGGAFQGRFETNRFQGFRYPANDRAVVEITLDVVSGSADPALVLYGPQALDGSFGQAVNWNDDGGAGLNARIRTDHLESGAYLIVVTAHGSNASRGAYNIQLRCLEGCQGEQICSLRPVCADTSLCQSGFLLDEEGCPTCECDDECRSADHCGPGDVCLQGVCHQDCGCRDAFAPVCGRDGHTYSTQCEATCQGVEVASNEACRTDCPTVSCDLVCEAGFAFDADGCEMCECQDPCVACDLRLEPVCTTNGITVQNSCQAECRGDEVLYRGPCRTDCEPLPDDCPSDCTGGLAIGADGCPLCECRDDRCPAEAEPVCGMNGVTFPSACDADLANVEVRFNGPCPFQCQGMDECPDDYLCESGIHGLPDCDVTGTDCIALCNYQPQPCVGDEDCLLGDQCRVNTAGATCSSACDCPNVLSPVCGTDGRTYDNICRARCAGFAAAAPGPCCAPFFPDACSLSCTDGFLHDDGGCLTCNCAPLGSCQCDDTVERPVCGSDGLIYQNECRMRCAGAVLASSEFCE